MQIFRLSEEIREQAERTFKAIQEGDVEGARWSASNAAHTVNEMLYVMYWIQAEVGIALSDLSGLFVQCLHCGGVTWYSEDSDESLLSEEKCWRCFEPLPEKRRAINNPVRVLS